MNKYRIDEKGLIWFDPKAFLDEAVEHAYRMAMENLGRYRPSDGETPPIWTGPEMEIDAKRLRAAVEERAAEIAELE